jgi:peptidoglycan/LPS O-acetylase OafA/YrhL
MSTARSFRLGHPPCLDGVRGFAILAVLVYHLPTMPISGGFLGVDLFFVLSGFLITSLLLEEWNTRKTIGLGRFYLRRALRLLPVLLLVVTACLTTSYFVETPQAHALTRRMALYALGYVANYAHTFGVPNNPFLGVTWSLSVEEHFYSLWPVTLLFLLRARWPRWAVVVVVVGLIAGSAALRGYYWLQDRTELRAYFYTPARLDGVLIGSLTALMLSWGCAPRSMNTTWFLRVAGGVSIVTFFSLAINGSLGPAYYLAGTALNAGWAILISSLLLTPSGLTKWIFENRGITRLGKISYGLYLWHPFAYFLASRLRWGKQVHGWLLYLGLAIGIAALSYLLVERPFLAMKSKFSSRTPDVGTEVEMRVEPGATTPPLSG